MSTITENDLDLETIIGPDITCGISEEDCRSHHTDTVTHYARNTPCGCVILLCTTDAEAESEILERRKDDESMWACATCGQRQFGRLESMMEVRSL